jgi:hypothetical protein
MSRLLFDAFAGRGREASRLSRLRASDLPPAVAEVALSGDTVRRTAAALLFPIAPNDFQVVERSCIRASIIAGDRP